MFNCNRRATTVSRQEEHVYQSDRTLRRVFIVAVSQLDKLVDNEWHPAAGFMHVYPCAGLQKKFSNG